MSEVVPPVDNKDVNHEHETISNEEAITEDEIKLDAGIDRISNLDNEHDSLENIETIDDIEFQTKIDAYEVALKAFETASPATHETALQLLLTRDAVQKILETTDESSVELLLRLPPLDKQLNNYKEEILQAIHLSVWRKILNPPSKNWWWFFEPAQVPHKVDVWDRLDWLWNLLTILCLTGFVSYMSKVLPLVSSNGLSVFESIGLVGPGGMVALVLSSMQGGKGREKIQQVLGAVGIPTRFQSEATLLIGVILFSGSYFAQAYLPESYFKTYFAAGEKAYKKGQLREARENYEQALKIDGQESAKVAAIYTSLGLIDESLGNDNEAFKNYARALDLGDLKVLNNMARVKIYKGEFDAAETFLNLGIQKGDKTSISDQYQLYRNLGWTYLEKKRYAQAEEFLTKAIDFDKQIAKGAFGKGMANCFKAKVYELQERPDKAANQWNLCTEFGKPETFHEYQAILKINPEIGRKLDTTGIFQ